MAINAAKRITSTGAATTGKTFLRGVIVETAGTATGRLTLSDGNGGATKVDFSTQEADTTVPIYFPAPGIEFASGVWVATLTDIDAVTFITG